jgi:hypothetical protein
MPDQDVYATPRIVSIDDCFFYHTLEVPGYGLRTGFWDMRKTWRQYLGAVDLRGKRVFEIGTADGFICFNMEKMGARMVAYDLSEDADWDIVPFAGYDYEQYALDKKDQIRHLNNAYWLCHRAFNSNAKMVYGSVYSVPREIGEFDVSVFGSILLHVRDPFNALRQVLSLTKETVIVAEPYSQDLVTRILMRIKMPYMRFQPDFRRCEPKDAWWFLPPATIKQFIGVLGFEDVQVHYHFQQTEAWDNYRRIPYYTIVGRRTKGHTSAL